jgi:hypothetical protein
LVLGVAEDAELGIVFRGRSGDGAGEEKILVLLGLMQLCYCATLAFVLAVHTFLEPVGN